MAASVFDRGAYTAQRAAALSGVPLRTVYDWARRDIVAPSISPTRTKLWSYGDLLTLRLVRWLRIDKPEVAATKMSEVLATLDRFGDDLWHDTGADRPMPTLAVTRDGEIVHRRRETVSGQQVMEVLDLLAPYEQGVDLRTPTPHTRIVPGRVAGQPHLVGTRLLTTSIMALSQRGFDVDAMLRLYPDEDPVALVEAVELEQKLALAA